MLQKPKSVKLRALRSPRKFGVAGRSCQEVLRKGCLRFQLPERGSRLCLYEDGTELTEDYFPSVADNAELVLLTSGQAWQGSVGVRARTKTRDTLSLSPGDCQALGNGGRCGQRLFL
ncbi:DFFB isoform 7 [Pongo abelii]|uniref:DNA fragmentation factor subunit beta n=1 Tax=Pongo abelii TaxID=9601 RepID=A0A2J8URR0_PONAB|nr:DFFB isoform 7 [Pongo abelii]